MRDPFDVPEQDETADDDYVSDTLDWTAEQEAGWAFEDRLEVYRNEY